MGEGDNSGGGTPATTREYRISRALTLTEESFTPEAYEALKKELGFDGPYEVDVRVGRAEQATPPKALKVAAELRGLNGTFDVIAASAITTLPVATETKTEATVG